MPTVTWEKDGRLLAGPSLMSGNESTLHIESTEVGAPLFSPYLGFLFVPQFFLSWLCRWLMLACTPAWPLALQGRTAGASMSASKVVWPQECSEEGASRGCCRMAQALGDQEPEHPCILLWDWCGLQKRALEHSDGPAEWGPMHDLRGQVWGCPTHVAHPETPARVPQHHPASQALGRSPSSRLWQGASSSWSAQGVLSLIPTSSGTGRAPCYRYL